MNKRSRKIITLDDSDVEESNKRRYLDKKERVVRFEDEDESTEEVQPNIGKNNFLNLLNRSGDIEIFEKSNPEGSIRIDNEQDLEDENDENDEDYEDNEIDREQQETLMQDIKDDNEDDQKTEISEEVNIVNPSNIDLTNIDEDEENNEEEDENIDDSITVLNNNIQDDNNEANVVEINRPIVDLTELDDEISVIQPQENINNNNIPNLSNLNNNNNNNNRNTSVIDLTDDVIDLTDESVTFHPPRQNQNNRIINGLNSVFDFIGINFIILNLLNSRNNNNNNNHNNQRPSRPPRTEKDLVKRKKIEGNCPICLEDMEEGQNISYCRYGCGNNVHSKCFKKWDKDICVMCREYWN